MATLLLDLRALLLDLRALLVELALPKTTSPSDRYSKLCLGRNSSDSRGLELRYATWQEAFQYIVWFNASCPFCPLLNSYFSHLFRLDLVSTWVKVPHLGKFIWFQYLNFPRCASHQTSYISCIHWVSISILPPNLSAASCIHLVSTSKLPPGAPTTSCFHLVSYVGPPWPPSNFLQASRFNILKLSHTCASQKLPALMRFQYLRFSPSSLHNFLHASSFGLIIFALIWFEYLYLPPALASPQTSCVHLVSISKIPPRCPSTTSCIHLVSILNLLPGARQ